MSSNRQNNNGENAIGSFKQNNKILLLLKLSFKIKNIYLGALWLAANTDQHTKRRLAIVL